MKIVKNGPLGLVLAAAAMGAGAQDMNLGDARPAPPGTFAYINYFGALEARSLYNQGNRIDGSVKVAYSANRFAWFTQVGGMAAVVNAIVPVAAASVRIPAAGLADHESGLGDPVVAAGIYPINDADSRSHMVLAGLLSLPLGRYEPSRPAVSPGANRVTFTGELGFEQGLGSWTLATNAQYKVFGRNDDFAGGLLRTRPLLRLQAGAFYHLSPTTYLGPKFKHESGARETVNGAITGGNVRLTRAAVEWGHFFTRRDQLIVAPYADVSVRTGARSRGAQLRYLHVF
jgi:hypothetical protein